MSDGTKTTAATKVRQVARDLAMLVAMLAAYVVLSIWVLPRFGIYT